ncbi:MAG: chromosome segregation protein SMC [Candidatus Micrarchaeia archaeon]
MAFINRILFRGFKSFRNTEILLNNGFVCVAGPNGSGKSNVCDGIRFILGENSLKALRANRISDLIYKGTDRAEITIVLETDGTHEIRRIIRKDGKTKYKLDGKTTTRTSVVEFLRKCGFETGHHNIIAQGQVQRIVEMNPQERREVLERASGISEFEEKKKEALGELAKVEQNINDAKIILREREGMLNELEKERADALRYQEINGELRRVKGSLIYMKMKNVDKEHTNISKKHIELKQQEKELSERLEGLSREIENITKKKNDIVAKINELTEKNNLSREVEDIKTAIKINETKLLERRSLLVRLGSEIKKLEEACTVANRSLADLVSERNSVEKELSELLSRISGIEEKNRLLMQEAGKKAERSRLLREQWLGKIEELRGLEKDLHTIDAEIYRSENEIQILENELKKLLLNLQERRKFDTTEIEREISELTKKKNNLSEEIDALFLLESEKNKLLPQLDKKILSLREKLVSLPRRGSSALDVVLKLKNDGQIKGICGTVGELCTFDAAYTDAIEAAAGPRLDYVVVENIDVATKVIEYLKKQKAGRCAFIPIAQLVVHTEDSPPHFRKVLDVVKFDKKLERVFHYVFGDTLLFESIEEAKKYAGKYRMVTKDGELIEKSSVVFGGYSKSPSALRVKEEAKRIEVELENARIERDKIEKELHKVREMMAGKRKEISRIEVELKNKEIELAEMKGRIETAMKGISEQEAEAKSIEKKIAEIKKILSGKHAEKTAKETEIKRVSDEVSSLAKLLESAGEEDARGHDESQLAEMKKKEAELRAKLAGIAKEWEMLKTQIVGKEEEIRLKKTEASHIEVELNELTRQIEETNKLLEEKSKKLKKVSAELESLWEERDRIDAELEKVAREKGEIEQRHDKVQKEVYRIELQKENIDTQLSDLKAEFEEFKDITPLDLSKEELEEMHGKLQAELAALGDVNMKAPELYEQRKSEIEEIKGRVEKLDEEKRAVMRMIEEIDRKKTNIFLETLRGINENFKRLYSHAFDGEATLYLDNPSNPFEGGLHIKVKENGVEKNVDSMSGGEKSLLALLFIFSIQMQKPSPFYILDESDAALDKENSKRFSELIKELSKTAQFLVITHNDVVLSSADSVIGITKTPDGSKAVGVELT